MKRLIRAETAGRLLLIAFWVMMAFHVLVLRGYIDPGIIWGGRMGDSKTRLLTMELLAVGLTAIFIVLIVSKRASIASGKSNRVVSAGIWFLFGFLLLNTQEIWHRPTLLKN